MSMKKKLSLLGFILFIVSVLSGCDQKEPCLSCIEDEPLDFRVIDYEPAWSPDGEWIAYVHRDPILEKNGIYLIRHDGTDGHLWEDYATSPTWSPDSKWIAFSKGGQIEKKKIDGDSLTQLTFEGRNFSPSWSPDGNYITYKRSYAWPEALDVQGLWKLNMETYKTSQYFQGNSGEPEWIDENNIFYTIGNINTTGGLTGFNCYIINIETLHQDKILFLSNINWFANYRYSKYSNKILCTSSFANSSIKSISIIDMSEFTLVEIIKQGYSADWNPDGKKIAYTDSRGENGYLWIIDLEIKEKHQLTFDN